jgi:hypothetical protein
MASYNDVQNVTIAMWYTPVESRGVGVSSWPPILTNTQQIIVFLGARSHRYVIPAIGHHFDHHHGRTFFLSICVEPLLTSLSSPGVRNSQYSVP